MTGDRQIVRAHALVDSLSWGGAERLLAGFAELAPSVGIELSVGFLAAADGMPMAPRLRAAGVEPEFVPIAGLRNLRDLRSVRRHLEQVAPHLLHTHLEYADVLGGCAARTLSLPVVSTVHATAWSRAPRSYAKSRLAAVVRRHCAARVLTVSDSARRSYLHRR
jgi:hypothetical protein